MNAVCRLLTHCNISSAVEMSDHLFNRTARVPVTAFVNLKLKR